MLISVCLDTVIALYGWPILMTGTFRLFVWYALHKSSVRVLTKARRNGT